MYKIFIHITVIAIFFSAFAEASQEKAKESKDKEKLIDGLNIMTMVSERNWGEDYIISTSWRLSITWQKISGLWFWKKAVVEKIQKKYKTFIIVEDVKVNAGLDNREFTKGVLERKRFCI